MPTAAAAGGGARSLDVRRELIKGRPYSARATPCGAGALRVERMTPPPGGGTLWLSREVANRRGGKYPHAAVHREGPIRGGGRNLCPAAWIGMGKYHGNANAASRDVCARIWPNNPHASEPAAQVGGCCPMRVPDDSLAAWPGWWLCVRCACGRGVWLPVKLLTRAHGPDARLTAITARLRCSRCGARPTDARMSENPQAEAPGYVRVCPGLGPGGAAGVGGGGSD